MLDAIELAQRIHDGGGFNRQPAPCRLRRLEPQFRTQPFQRLRRVTERTCRQVRGGALQRVRRRREPDGVASVDGGFDGRDAARTKLEKETRDVGDKLDVAAETLQQELIVNRSGRTCRRRRNHPRGALLDNGE